ncbi:hypothetical protein LTR84_001243 [Exophiala bonariae]|uniref:Uncharacterized protein n=1 Tax=Exophiala bonariae TaxID=1690606 RepID=A0AAV9NVG8_9EURO|nr:hypothetical protein LTR84_001243 [Exophiala bonariae]
MQAQGMIEHLRKVKDDKCWDLADVCLAQCETVTHRMSDGTYLDFRRQRAARAQNSSTTGLTASDTDSPLAQVRTNSGQTNNDALRGTVFDPQPSDTSVELHDVRGSHFDFGTQEVGGFYGLNTLLDNQWDEFGYMSEPHVWEYPSLDDQIKF